MEAPETQGTAGSTKAKLVAEADTNVSSRGSIGTFYNYDTSMQHNKRMLLNIVMIHNISYKEAGGCMCENIYD